MHKIESSLLACLNFYSIQNKCSNNNQPSPLYIAYSGGLDSSVLLFASYQLLKQKLIHNIKALHVNHGISDDSDDWQKHCEATCQNLGIELCTTNLNFSALSEKVSENEARNARYKFFEEEMIEGSLIAFAHHQDDQAETLLFRLFRGTGISGARGILESRPFGQSRVIRPFLKFTKTQLLDYAKHHNLEWIEDLSNQETLYSRNIIRNQLLPLIKETWPSVTTSLASFSSISQEQNEILLEVASYDLKKITLQENVISLDGLQHFSTARQKNMIHYWITHQKNNRNSSPSNQEINELLAQINQPKSKVYSSIETSKTKKINVKLGDYRARLFDSALWLCGSKEPNKLEKTIVLNESTILNKTNASQLIFAENKLSITFNKTSQNKLAVNLPRENETVSLRCRSGGESVRPHYRQKSCDLKKIYQELKIPHWKREWLPIVYYNEDIVCVPGVFANYQYLAKENQSGIVFKLADVDE